MGLLADDSQPSPTTAPEGTVNPSALVLGNAALGATPAVVLPEAWDHDRVTSETVLSFGELVAAAQDYRVGLRRRGLGLGHRVAMLAPLTPDLLALLVALAAEGVAPVFLDPGMGQARMRQAIRLASADALVATRWLLRLAPVIPELRAIRLRLCSDGPGRRAEALGDLRTGAGVEAGDLRPVPGDALANIAFTTGSTGRPKGVARALRSLVGTYEALEAELGGLPGEVVLTSFPAFAFYFLSTGRTVVIPPMEHGRPAQAPAGAVIDIARRHRVGSMLVAPSLLGRLVDHTARTGEHIAGLQRVWTGGAPVPKPLVEQTLALWPGVAPRVLYGSTEVEPIASSAFADVAASHGDGFLVGHENPHADVAVVAPLGDRDTEDRGPFDPMAAELPPASVGEILVAGPHVVETYWADPDATRQLKIPDAGGRIWHRTGDTGYRDAVGRLWLTGRTADLVTTADGQLLQPLPIEARLDAVPGARRTALVAHARARHGELLVEVEAGAAPLAVSAAVRCRLLAADLDLPVAIVPSIPLDRRHNSKIDRPRLRSQREHPRRSAARGKARRALSAAGPATRAIARLLPAKGETRP
jgi:acyl-CoA synthetase (AMP-forming)/AMP-acid ligase II